MAKARTNKSKSTDVEGHTDPRAPLDSARLLAAATPVLKLLAEDLLARAKASPAVTTALEARHASEHAARRTADPFAVWQTNLVDQVAAAWMLSCVFVRTLEDRGLIAQARLAGPGAADSQRLFFDLGPSLTERDYLLTVFRELSRFPGARDLFDAKHNPVWLLTPSAEAAKALLAMFRMPSAEAPAFRFGQADTRFLGDLYQDLNEAVQKRYALLQTPRFVEAFILDRTLERAIERFGLDEATVIDPTCGSGHFLLGSFERLFDHRLRAEPGKGPREAARKALDAVYGADINPYAVAIARFRLTLAYLEKAGFSRLAEAPALPLHLVVADSLLHNAQLEQKSFSELEGQSAKVWGGEEFALEDEAAAREVLHRRYAAVVGNPPYITVKDAVLRERYRELYVTAAGKYSLAAPFAQRFFQLARDGGAVGMITANSFMKREFGKKLIEEYLPTVNLDLIINTSGAYIPGHGTPTVLLFGTMGAAEGTDVLAVLAKRGEPTTPDDAEQGLVWRSIADHWSEPAFENDYVSMARVERKSLAKHPWSLGGGGAAELKELLEERAEKRLGEWATDIGFDAIMGEDELFFGDSHWLDRLGAPEQHVRALCTGEVIRDWSIAAGDHVYFPYDTKLEPAEPTAPAGVRAHFWRYRRNLVERRQFGKNTLEAGLKWFEYRSFYKSKRRTPLSIAFAFVATHNHFVLDRGGKVFKQSAPIIKLPETATEDDHLALLAYLNSSTACFWMKQACMNKGGSGIGRGVQDEAWESRFEFDGTKLGLVPLPDGQTLAALRPFAYALERQAASREAAMPAQCLTRYEASKGPSLAEDLQASRAFSDLDLACMVSVQEELDWRIYEALGLLTEDDRKLHDQARGEALPSFPVQLQPHTATVHRHGLYPGHRAFEVVLARDVLSSGTKTAWFVRNDYRSPSEVRDLYSPAYQRLIEVRVAIIDRNAMVRLLEQPEHKRRWTLRDWNAEVESAARAFVLDRLEVDCATLTAPVRPADLGARALREAKAIEVIALLDSSGAADTKARTARLVSDAAVPYLATLRYPEATMQKHALWERTWDLQRREDAGEAVGEIPVPPKYDSTDYRDPIFWRLRGKLDVPKERFISYPGCESDQDGEPVYGWAGWNHLQRAQALAALYQKRKQEEAWDKGRLTPMLAGLLELLPWIKQWHNEPSEEYQGMRLGDFFEGFLDSECRSLGLTHDDLRAWRPADKKRGKATAKAKGKGKAKKKPEADEPAEE